MNAIKELEDLCKTNTTTFLKVFMAVIEDTNRNPATESSIFPVNIYIPDMSSPSLVSFSLDFNLDQLYLTFSESVRADLVNSSNNAIALVDPSDLNATSYVSPGNVIGSDNAVISINGLKDIIDGFVNLINKLHSLFETQIGYPGLEIFKSFFTDLRIIIFSNATSDHSSNPVASIPITEALKVTYVNFDVTKPSLSFFDLDLNQGLIHFYFDDIINVNTLEIRSIQLVSPLATFVTLTSGTVISVTTRDIQILLNRADLNLIKDDRNLATNASNVLISFSDTLILDIFGNPINSESVSNLIRIYIPDTTGPLFVSYTFQMEISSSGDRILPLFITLTYDEVIELSTVNVSKITFYDKNETFSNLSIALNTSFPTLLSPTQLIINISREDLAGIILASPIGLYSESTFIFLDVSFVEDSSSNDFVALLQNPVQPILHSADLIRPSLAKFELDMNSAELVITFSEKVNESTLNPSSITLLGERNGSSSSVTLDFLTVFTLIDNVATFTLDSNDFLQLQLMEEIALSSDSTYIFILSSLVQDYAENTVLPILPDSALQVSTFTPDYTRPILESYSVFLSESYLLFSFSEPINLTSFNPLHIRFQNDKSNPTSTYTITGGKYSSPNGRNRCKYIDRFIKRYHHKACIQI